MGKSFNLTVLFACVSGIVIAWIDSQPNWDDSGISAFMVLLVSMLAAYLAKQKPWLIALAVGVWIPIYGIIFTQNFGSLLALLPGIIGAYTGWWIERILTEK
jgi:fructose-specific phosphotransferase system IIC component